MNFMDEVNKNVKEIEKPPMLPIGSYQAMVKKIPEVTTSADNKWDNVDFPLQMMAPGEDVDLEALKEFGGLGPMASARRRFLFNKEDETAFKRTEYDLKRFLIEHLLIEDGENKTLKQLMNESVNHRCMAFIGWRADKTNPETQYVEVRKTGPLG